MRSCRKKYVKIGVTQLSGIFEIVFHPRFVKNNIDENLI